MTVPLFDMRTEECGTVKGRGGVVMERDGDEGGVKIRDAVGMACRYRPWHELRVMKKPGEQRQRYEPLVFWHVAPSTQTGSTDEHSSLSAPNTAPFENNFTVS